MIPVVTCFMLLRQPVRRADSRARAKTGNKIAARIAMMAMTTSSSISVNPRSRRVSMEGTLLRSRGTPRVAHPAVHRHRAISCLCDPERPEGTAKARREAKARSIFARKREGGESAKSGPTRSGSARAGSPLLSVASFRFLRAFALNPLRAFAPFRAFAVPGRRGPSLPRAFRVHVDLVAHECSLDQALQLGGRGAAELQDAAERIDQHVGGDS